MWGCSLTTRGGFSRSGNAPDVLVRPRSFAIESFLSSSIYLTKPLTRHPPFPSHRTNHVSLTCDDDASREPQGPRLLPADSRQKTYTHTHNSLTGRTMSYDDAQTHAFPPLHTTQTQYTSQPHAQKATMTLAGIQSLLAHQRRLRESENLNAAAAHPVSPS